MGDLAASIASVQQEHAIVTLRVRLLSRAILVMMMIVMVARLMTTPMVAGAGSDDLQDVMGMRRGMICVERQ